MGCGQKSSLIAWRCHQLLFWLLVKATYPECHDCHPMMMRKSTAEEIHEKNLASRLSGERCATIHRLKWGPLPPNEVCRIAKHVWKGEGRKGRSLCYVTLFYKLYLVFIFKFKTGLCIDYISVLDLLCREGDIPVILILCMLQPLRLILLDLNYDIVMFFNCLSPSLSPYVSLHLYMEQII